MEGENLYESDMLKTLEHSRAFVEATKDEANQVLKKIKLHKALNKIGRVALFISVLGLFVITILLFLKSIATNINLLPALYVLFFFLIVSIILLPFNSWFSGKMYSKFHYRAMRIHYISLCRASLIKNTHNPSKPFLDKALYHIDLYCEIEPTTANSMFRLTALRDIEENIFWFKYSAETEQSIIAFRNFLNKLSYRISQNIETNNIIEILDFLQCYLYIMMLKYSQSNTTFQNRPIDELGMEYINHFSIRVNDLSVLTLPKGNTIKKITFLKRLKNNISNLLASSSMITSFFSWLFLLFSIDILIALPCIRYTKIPLDSTLLGLIIGIPLTLAVSMAIANKNNDTKKDDESQKN